MVYIVAEASEVGVCYGTLANDLPDPATATKMLVQNGITMVRLFDADLRVLTSLANTSIKAMVPLPNENLTAAATDPSYVLDWVRRHVAAYHSATAINCVGVGNEVFLLQAGANAAPRPSHDQRACSTGEARPR